MTEADWLASADPEAMLQHIRPILAPRAERLFAVAVCRRIRGLLDDSRSLFALDTAESFANGQASADELKEAAALAAAVWMDPDDMLLVVGDEAKNYAAAAVAHAAGPVAPGLWAARTATTAARHRVVQATVVPAFALLLRDIVGNPFRPVSFDPACRTSTAVALATTADDDRAYDRLPILADALEEAGCDSAELLAHLRGPGPHVRGCWAVDLVLGRA